MRYPRSSETGCTSANSPRTTCLHGLRVRLILNPLCWLGILFRSQSKWAFNGFSAIGSGFASKQVFDGRSYRRARPIAWGQLGWLSHPKTSVVQNLESSSGVPTGAEVSAPPPRVWSQAMPSAHSAWLKCKLKCSNATSLLDACLRKSVFSSCAAYRAIRIQTPTSRIASCLFCPVRTGLLPSNDEIACGVERQVRQPAAWSAIWFGDVRVANPIARPALGGTDQRHSQHIIASEPTRGHHTIRANTYVFTSCRSVTFDREGPVGVTGSFRESGTIYVGVRTGPGRARLRWETISDTEIG